MKNIKPAMVLFCGFLVFSNTKSAFSYFLSAKKTLKFNKLNSKKFKF